MRRRVGFHHGLLGLTSFFDEFVVPPQGYVVLGTTDMPMGLSPDYEFEVPLFGSFSQNLLVSCFGDNVDGVAMDFVGTIDSYDTVDGEFVEIAPGASMQLDPDPFDHISNNQGSNWCASTSVYPGGLGTPGAPNDPC